MPEAIYKIAPIPVMGLNKDAEPTKFDGAYSPYMNNAIVETTRVRKRRGYSQLGSSSLPLSGIGAELINYRDATGDTHLIAITSTKAYLYDSTNDAWTDITPLSGDFSGGADNRFSNCLATDDSEFPNNGGTALLISNGVDDVHFYEGDADDKFAVLAHLFPSFGNTKEIEEFWNHLFFINYNDGNNQVRALAFADAGNVDTWLLGTSGSNVLTDTRGDLLRAKKLGPFMILYSEKSITVCKYYGGNTIFSFPTLVYETGLLAAKAVWDFVNVHYFLGTDQKVYGYYGGTDLIPVGKRIEDSLFADIDVSKKAKIVTGLDIGRHKVIFFTPRSGDTYPNVGYALSYNRKGLPWEYYEFADTVRDFGTFENFFAWYCDDTRWGVNDYCDEQSFYCDESYGQTDYPMAVFITDDGYVMKLDEAAGLDDDANIVFELWSPEFVVDDEETFGRWLWVSFTATSGVASSTITVSYSIDSGTTWTALSDSPVSLTTDWATYRLPLTVLSRRIMFKIYQNSAKDVQLRGNFRCKVIPQSARD